MIITEEYIKQFNDSFSKFGFMIKVSQENRIVAFSQGKEFGVYLEIWNNTFSIECVLNPFSNKIFTWQHFQTLQEIEQLIINNHILSEQICEQNNLAIYT